MNIIKKKTKFINFREIYVVHKYFRKECSLPLVVRGAVLASSLCAEWRTSDEPWPVVCGGGELQF